MADYEYKVPSGQEENFMVGTLDAPGNGVTVPMYSIVAGNTNDSFKIGTNDGVIEVNSNTYGDELYPMELTVERTDDDGTIPYTVEMDLTGLFLKKTPTMYVDPANGSNANPGTMSHPVSSLDLAYYRLMGGGAILLYTGNYGSRSFTGKPCTIKGLEGNTPVLNGVSLDGGYSFVLDTVVFTDSGVLAVNPAEDITGSSLMIRGCEFGGTTAIEVERYKYVSIVKNKIYSSSVGVSLKTIYEATVLSNTIFGEEGAPVELGFFTSAVIKLEMLHNTIDAVTTVSIDDVPSASSFGMRYVPVTSELLASGTIGPFPYPFEKNYNGDPAVTVNVASAMPASLGTDFTVPNGDTIQFAKNPNYPATEPDDPYLWDYLELGDVVLVIYELVGSDEPVAPGDESYTNVLSNSVTNVSDLVFASGFTADIRFNNLFNTVTTAPIGPSNILTDPQYTDKDNGDFSLEDSSPNRKRAALYPNGMTANRTSPYQKNQGMLGANRAYKGENADIGSIENLSDVNGRTEEDLNIGQQGYDVAYDGDSDRPLKRLSRAFADETQDDINFELGGKTDGVSDRKMYLDDHSLNLSSAALGIVDNQPVMQYLDHRDTAFVQPFDQPGQEGLSAYVSMDGSDTEGDGSFANPFRTITHALGTEAEVVNVVAGSYPLFEGVEGKKVVFLPRNDFYLIGGFLNTDLQGSSWKVSDDEESTYDFAEGLFTVSHPPGE